MSERYRAPLRAVLPGGPHAGRGCPAVRLVAPDPPAPAGAGSTILRVRLTRRGLTLSAGLLATALSEQAAGASLPAGLVNHTLNAVLPSASKAAAAGIVQDQRPHLKGNQNHVHQQISLSGHNPGGGGSDHKRSGSVDLSHPGSRGRQKAKTRGTGGPNRTTGRQGQETRGRAG